MASTSEIDYCCPVCQEIYTDPVLLPCSHSFCNICLQNSWIVKPNRECPLCRTVSAQTPIPIPALNNLCVSLLRKRNPVDPETVCSVHREELKLFCLDHLQHVCIICRFSETHYNHKIRPMEEAAEHLKKKIRNVLQPLKDKLKYLNEVREASEGTEDHIELQMKEQRVKRQQEEESRVRGLREEVEQKSQRMKDKMEAVSREREVLSQIIQVTEEELTAEHLSFLCKCKATLERVQQHPLLKV